MLETVLVIERGRKLKYNTSSIQERLFLFGSLLHFEVKRKKFQRSINACSRFSGIHRANEYIPLY